MANGYNFPPPPPPPPAPTTASFNSFSSNPSSKLSQPQRGRGGYNPTFQRGGRGRAGYAGSRGDRSGPQSGYSYQQRNGFSTQPILSNGRQVYASQQQSVPVGFNQTSTASQVYTKQTQPIDSYGYKRKHDQAFQRPTTAPKIQTAPSVPSFGFQLPSLTPQANETAPKTASTIPPKRNLLGLIPIDDEEDATDEDEESKLASVIGIGSTSALSFLHNGKVATLRTPEDIAAWIAERRKNFPTAARREAMMKQKAEERAKAMEAKEIARKKVIELKKDKQVQAAVKQVKPKDRRVNAGSERTKARDKLVAVKKEATNPRAPDPVPSLTKEQLKIEKLRKSMEKNARKLAKLEAASKKIHSAPPQPDPKTADINTNSDNTIKDLVESDCVTSSEEEVSSSDPSSSDDSDTGSDLDSLSNSSSVESIKENKINEDYSSDSDAPQELSSIRTGPIRVPPPPRGKEDHRALCRDLRNHGQCRRKFCKFRHKPKDGEISTRNSQRKQEPKPRGRISLYQRLLQQQIEADERTQPKSDMPSAAE